MRYFTLKDVGFAGIDAIEPANARSTEPIDRPFGWSLRDAMLCLFDDYAVSPKRFARSLRDDIAKAGERRRVRRPIAPEPFVLLALVDESGENLRAVDWSRSVCVEIVTDAIERYWWRRHKAKGLRPNQDVPEAITNMRIDCFGTRWDWEWVDSMGSLFQQALLLDHLNLPRANSTALRAYDVDIARMQRLRHYISLGHSDVDELSWLTRTMLRAHGEHGRFWEAATGGNFWDTAQVDPWSPLDAQEPAWFQIYSRLGGRVNRSISAPEVMAKHMSHYIWQFTSQRSSQQSLEFVRWATCSMLDDALMATRKVMQGSGPDGRE